MKTKIITQIKTSALILSASVAGTSVQASSDYGPAIWNPPCNANYYTTGYGHKFHVVHDMEGYYLSVISMFNRCGYTSASVHYLINGLKDTSTDSPAGEITQSIAEANYAWHVVCWNRYCTGTEHEGFVSNPAWYTEAQYQASAGVTRHIADKFGYAKDRNHIVGHNEWQNANWTAWAGPNFGINTGCNTHTDPGVYWDWTHYMNLVNGANPSYWLFDTGTDGWTLGNSLVNLGWTASGWPGVIYADQNGNDAWFYSPATSYSGPGAGLVNVSVYPQSGTTANHDMQVFYKTAAEPYYDAAKSSAIVNYTCQNNWIRLNLNLNQYKYVGQNIQQLRLDVDNNNSGTRWIVNHVVSQSALLWTFDTDPMGWTLGNGVANLGWTATGWPGVIYFDQTANDAYIMSATSGFDQSGPFKYLGGANDRIHVRVYPQNGNTASHDMQVYFTTTTDGVMNEAKSVYTTYTGQNQWVDVYLNVGSNPYWRSDNNNSGGISQIRLDLDNINHGNRWIIDYINIEQQ